jgi:hypothetical protein
VPETTRASQKFVWLDTVEAAIRAALGEIGSRDTVGFEFV